MSKYVKMYTKEYAKLRGITPTAVTIAINEGRKLPGVKKIEKHIRYFQLTVDINEVKLKKIKSHQVYHL